MKLSRFSLLLGMAAFSVCGASLFPFRAFAQGPPPEGEVLTRGPLHEAFAEAMSRDPEPGIVIEASPPEPIDELPPELQPEGENVTWISGYWAWDEDGGDFLWVSGVWRNIPPGRAWIPGYWAEAGAQFQWISGYWEDLDVEEVAYLPRPPASVERGPNVPPPSGDYSWIPGGWVWSGGRYLWRPGYWELLREEWTYVPDCYQWTPRGYIHVPGYWDYPLAYRGVLFAPVHFHREVYRRPGFCYSPATVISLDLVSSHLFVRPAYGHYYYGDYYEPQYRQRGFYASFSYDVGPDGGYDPIHAHERWEHRHDGDWDRHCREDYEYFRDHRDARPPKSFDKLRELPDGRRGFTGRHGDYAIATPIKHFEKSHDSKEKFRKVDASSHERLLAQRKAMSDFQRERKGHESSHSPTSSSKGKAVGGGAETKTPPIKLHRSPVVGRKVEELSKEKAPPQRRGGSPTSSKTETVRRAVPEPKREEKMEPRRGGISPEPKKATGPSPKVEPRRGGSSSEPKREEKIEPKRGGSSSESKPQPKVEPRRGGSSSESKPQPKLEPRRGGSSSESKPTPKVEPRRGGSSSESKPTPKVEPRRGETKSVPKRETKPEPRAEPKRESKPEPKKESGSSRGGRDDDKKSKK